MKRYSFLVTIESDDYEDIGFVRAALLNRIDGWDVGSTVEPLSATETLDAKLAILNKKVRAAKDELALCEAARDAVCKEIRDGRRADEP